ALINFTVSSVDASSTISISRRRYDWASADRTHSTIHAAALKVGMQMRLAEHRHGSDAASEAYCPVEKLRLTLRWLRWQGEAHFREVGPASFIRGPSRLIFWPLREAGPFHPGQRVPELQRTHGS